MRFAIENHLKIGSNQHYHLPNLLSISELDFYRCWRSFGTELSFFTGVGIVVFDSSIKYENMAKIELWKNVKQSYKYTLNMYMYTLNKFTSFC